MGCFDHLLHLGIEKDPRQEDLLNLCCTINKKDQPGEPFECQLPETRMSLMTPYHLCLRLLASLNIWLSKFPLDPSSSDTSIPSPQWG